MAAPLGLIMAAPRAALWLSLALSTLAPTENAPWPRHVIDGASQGADGVRLADVNGDGLMDIATGWEEGGVVRAYLHPGHGRVKSPWPKISVGKVAAPEDAVFADLDGDGRMDVVSCTEGKTDTVWAHWAPANPGDYMDGSKWKTEAFPATVDAQKWMFCFPMQIDGKHGIDLVLGSKGENAAVGWLEAPDDPRDMSAWNYHVAHQAGWIMSIRPRDMDEDGDDDIVISDRRGNSRGVKWLENPGHGEGQSKPWTAHPIAGQDAEVMFMDFGDVNGDGLMDIVVAEAMKEIIYIKRSSAFLPPHWEIHPIKLPAFIGTGKAAAVGDINRDGKMDIVVTCENSQNAHGVFWLDYNNAPESGDWAFHEVSGLVGTKFDRMELIDLDGDGDLDVMTCEERENLGVIWYENPLMR